MALPDKTYIDNYIDEGQQAVLSLKNFYKTMLVGNIDNPNHIFRIPMEDFFINHRKELAEIIEFYSVPQTMFYKPKTVSYELYQTPELWLSLLRLNDMRNVTEFHMPIIRVYNPSQLTELVNIFFKREGVMS